MEYFDICDAAGRPTGETVSRPEAHRLGIRHRTAHIWIVRRAGARTEILLQKRSRNKDSYPGRWDTSSAGHIRAGDEPKESALRELAEELGVLARADELEFAGNYRIRYAGEFSGKAFRDNEVVFVYVYRGEVEIARLTLQAEEVESAAWFDLDDTIRAVGAGDERFCVPLTGLELLKAFLETGQVQDRMDPEE